MWKRMVPLSTLILARASLRNGLQQWVAFPHHLTYQGPRNLRRCKSLGWILLDSPPSPLDSDRCIRKLNCPRGWGKSGILQSFEHSLGHEVDTRSKVTKGIPNFLVVYSASDSRITRIFPVHNCWRFPWIKNLLYGPPCIVSNSCPPRWLAPSSGHCTNILTRRHGLPWNLPIPSKGNQSS
jgi:hypothetical protein